MRRPAANTRKRGGVTLEMAAVFIVIGIPLLLALAQLGRIDLASRRLQFAAQETVISTAMAENRDPDFRIIPVESSVQLRAGPEWSRLQDASDYFVTLKRRYWIGTGSGFGENW
jgi:hypothetical protein